MDGTNGSTTFTDRSSFAHAVTANGNVAISTAQSQFGDQSASFDGTGDFLSLSHASAFDFQSGDFTIEVGLRLNTVAASFQAIYDTSPNGSGGTRVNGFVWYISGNSLRVFSNGVDRLTASTTLVVNTWYHLALVKTGSTWYQYFNGTRDGNSANYAFATTSTSPIIGQLCNVPDSLNGFMDNLRVTKGVARYTGTSFTAPTGPYSLF